MSEKLAEVLGARIGDEVQVEVLEGRRAGAERADPRAGHRLRRSGRLHGHRRAAAGAQGGRHRQRRLSGASITSAGTSSCASSRTRRAPPS